MCEKVQKFQADFHKILPLLGLDTLFTATVIEHECTHNAHRRASPSRACRADRLDRV